MTPPLTELRVAVLAGGVSSEREVSLRSGAAVHEALLSKGLDAVLLDVDERAVEAVRTAQADIAFIALHGAFGEDGRIQQALEDAGIPYTGSGPEACRRAMDKETSRILFRKAGLSEPRWEVWGAASAPVEPPAGMGWPVFVKPCRGGSSIGVSQVRSRDEWAAAVAAARAEDDKIIVESKVTGREMAVGILGDHALPAIEIRPARDFYDYTAKYTNSGTQYVFPDDLPAARVKRIQETALAAHQALGCAGFSRVDLIVTDDAEYPLEVNAIPGLTATSLLPKQALREGILFADLCVMMIRESARSRGLKTTP
jgi:D-alanine-D-alanine ligase